MNEFYLIRLCFAVVISTLFAVSTMLGRAVKRVYTSHHQQ